MRKIIIMGSIIFGLFWIWHTTENFRESISRYVQNGEFLTLEARYTPEEIMNGHRQELLVDNRHTFQEPSLRFHPYLLMEVKYTQSDKKTKESVILWSLVDGEMVINTETWEKTHGFEDTLVANATNTDFKILNALAKNKGTMNRDQLQKELKIEGDVLDYWVECCKKKHLIVQRGNDYQLHFQNPKILVKPESKITQWLVTKPYNHAQRVPRKYSKTQITKLAKSAFGSEFTVRNITEIFLPVYSIEVLNPDGSILTTYWNALNGQRIAPIYMAER